MVFMDEQQSMNMNGNGHNGKQWQDNPVGTGFSYVEGGDRSLMAHTDDEAARDLVTLLCALYRDSPRLRGSPLYIVAESYGGKFAVTTALAALRAVGQGRLRATLAGVALGDSWISPLDFVVSFTICLSPCPCG